jgi:hypothetical protein
LRRNVPGVTKGNHDFCHEARRISGGFLALCPVHVSRLCYAQRTGPLCAIPSHWIAGAAAGMIPPAVEVKRIDVNRIDYSYPF